MEGVAATSRRDRRANCWRPTGPGTEEAGAAGGVGGAVDGTLEVHSAAPSSLTPVPKGWSCPPACCRTRTRATTTKTIRVAGLDMAGAGLHRCPVPRPPEPPVIGCRLPVKIAVEPPGNEDPWGGDGGGDDGGGVVDPGVLELVAASVEVAAIAAALALQGPNRGHPLPWLLLLRDSPDHGGATPSPRNFATAGLRCRDLPLLRGATVAGERRRRRSGEDGVVPPVGGLPSSDGARSGSRDAGVAGEVSGGAVGVGGGVDDDDAAVGAVERCAGGRSSLRWSPPEPRAVAMVVAPAVADSVAAVIRVVAVAAVAAAIAVVAPMSRRETEEQEVVLPPMKVRAVLGSGWKALPTAHCVGVGVAVVAAAGVVAAAVVAGVADGGTDAGASAVAVAALAPWRFREEAAEEEDSEGWSTTVVEAAEAPGATEEAKEERKGEEEVDGGEPRRRGTTSPEGRPSVPGLETGSRPPHRPPPPPTWRAGGRHPKTTTWRDLIG